MECFDDCGQYEVTPMLVSPCAPINYSEESPLCFPCLPRCPKGQVVYCCEKPSPPSQSKNCRRQQKLRDCGRRDTCERNPCSPQYCSPPPSTHCCDPAPTDCPKHCEPTCKPLKTKFVIPCYRYEDGRIRNQPTLLMKRACEVAVGLRPRKVPYVCSSYTCSPDHEISRYHSEDERGNCCYHFEKKNNKDMCCKSCYSCSPYVDTDCVRARPIDSPNGCYYYRCC